MPTEPENTSLLGFPNVEAEHPKYYIRRLWLVASNDRIPFPKFLDPKVCLLAAQVNRVVNTFVGDEDLLHEELSGNAFLEKDASRLLYYQGLGREIWGGPVVKLTTRLKTNACGQPPRWGVDTESGYDARDEASILLNLRYWMAARIQAKVNAPCADRRPKPSKTVESTSRLSPQPAPPSNTVESTSPSPSPPQPAPPSPCGSPQQTCSPGSSAVASAPAQPEHPEAPASRSSRARSDDSLASFDFVPFMHSSAGTGVSQSTITQPKRPRQDSPTGRSNSKLPRVTANNTLTAGPSVLSDTSTHLTIPDMPYIDNTDIGNASIHQIKRSLGLDLNGFLKGDLNYEEALSHVVEPAKRLYEDSPYRERFSYLHMEYKNFLQALEYWESLMLKSLSGAASPMSARADDPLEELASQETFMDRVAVLRRLRPRPEIWFSYETWTYLLAMFFEGLLGEHHMLWSFEELVIGLRDVNKSLNDTITTDTIAVVRRPIGGKRRVE